MDESERMQRIKQHRYDDHEEMDNIDKDFSQRIASILNHPKIDKYCMVDAYYYDFSAIPLHIQESLNLWRDHYLIFGITTEGEIVSKWVDRWDLDSSDPIVDGKVIHSDSPAEIKIPEITYTFNKDLLSTPIPNGLLKMFGIGVD